MINFLIYLFLVLEVICCFLLLVVILVQRSKSSGAGMAFGAGMGETMFGSQVGNVLTRSTVILGVSFLVITTILAYLTPRAGGRGATALAPDVQPEQQQQQPQQRQQPAAAPQSPAPAGSVGFPDSLPLTDGALDTTETPISLETPGTEVAPISVPATDLTPVEPPAELEPAAEAPPTEAAPAPEE